MQQGGSTITQQYAKNAFLTQQRTATRKVREIFISLKLAHSTSKATVLQDYLNTIYFGRGAYGIQAAAHAYFDKPVQQLTAAQGAVLAATIRSPALYDPERHPAAAQARWQYVVTGMVKKGWLTQAAADGAPYPGVVPRADVAGNGQSGPSGYVLDAVTEELERHGFGEDQLARGGYVVRTTLRYADQQAAVAAVEHAVGRPTAKTQPYGALVSVKPGTGEVFAYYGGSAGSGSLDFAGGVPRAPGSSFKPYVLADALSSGHSLSSTFPGSSPQTICGSLVHNDSGEQYGSIDLTRALALSVNTVYERLACDLGPPTVATTAHAAGIPGSVALHEVDGTVGAGIALGVYPVTVMDQAAGYATFADGGKAVTPYFVKSVTVGGSGKVVYTGAYHPTQAFSAGVAADATYAMQQVVAYGTGTRASLGTRPVAGKTGTTQLNKDAWFVGFTPQLATAVWVGRPDDAPLSGVLGIDGGGVRRHRARRGVLVVHGLGAAGPARAAVPRPGVGRQRGRSHRLGDDGVRRPDPHLRARADVPALRRAVRDAHERPDLRRAVPRADPVADERPDDQGARRDQRPPGADREPSRVALTGDVGGGPVPLVVAARVRRPPGREPHRVTALVLAEEVGLDFFGFGEHQAHRDDHPPDRPDGRPRHAAGGVPAGRRAARHRGAPAGPRGAWLTVRPPGRAPRARRPVRRPVRRPGRADPGGGGPAVVRSGADGRRPHREVRRQGSRSTTTRARTRRSCASAGRGCHDRRRAAGLSRSNRLSGSGASLTPRGRHRSPVHEHPCERHGASLCPGPVSPTPARSCFSPKNVATGLAL